MSPPTKTVPLLMLHNELNRLKDKSGVKDPEAGAYLGCAHTKINRILNMTSKPNVGDVRMLAEVYGADPELVKVLMDLARNLGKKGQWSGYKSIYRESARMMVDLERHCDRIQVASAELIHGLLQTENYIRALSRIPSASGFDFDENVAVQARLERQALLDRDVMVSFILSESALRREYGDHATMREQMLHLIEVGKRANVRLQVRPFASPNQTSHGWLRFTKIHVPSPGLVAPLDYVHVEQYDESRYIDDPEKVEAYQRLWDNLQAAALGPVESADFIGKVAEEYR